MTWKKKAFKGSSNKSVGSSNYTQLASQIELTSENTGKLDMHIVVLVPFRLTQSRSCTPGHNTWEYEVAPLQHLVGNELYLPDANISVSSLLASPEKSLNPQTIPIAKLCFFESCLIVLLALLTPREQDLREKAQMG
ncbi:hypothetical protein cyc_05115 [Cyclospora cayetanensis]|uniref:Uncharacterized protein n=1 Tax=Cyclospora cayetanensis TaxID=88456 RepID=A0A1D3D7Y8_9EIME|nr:hypothetical protein cyc_05115 [Cyclospora cayetanensis]